MKYIYIGKYIISNNMFISVTINLIDTIIIIIILMNSYKYPNYSILITVHAYTIYDLNRKPFSSNLYITP